MRYYSWRVPPRPLAMRGKVTCAAGSTFILDANHHRLLEVQGGCR